MRFHINNFNITVLAAAAVVARAAADTSSTGVVSNSSAGGAVDAVLAVLRGSKAAFKGSEEGEAATRPLQSHPFGCPPRRRQRRPRFERLHPLLLLRRRRQLGAAAPKDAVEKDDWRTNEDHGAVGGAWKGEVGAGQSATVEVPRQHPQ